VSRLPQPHTTFSKNGATFRFYLGDCVDILARLPRQSIDAIVTSPPYNLGIRYRSYDDAKPNEEYLKWTGEWVKETKCALSPDGSLFLNVGAKPTEPWTAFDVAQAARRIFACRTRFTGSSRLRSTRRQPARAPRLEDDLAVGHYKPINSKRFLHDCQEFIFHFTPEGATPIERQAIGVKYQDQSNVGRWRTAASGVRCRGNTWFIPYDTIQSRDKDRPHPATFPPRLPEMCLRLHGLERTRLVADPFLGLGSTAVACAQLGLDFIASRWTRSTSLKPSPVPAPRCNRLVWRQA
jgi:site-specific DNA-methyltransferase (adenine-specific)